MPADLLQLLLALLDLLLQRSHGSAVLLQRAEPVRALLRRQLRLLPETGRQSGDEMGASVQAPVEARLTFSAYSEAICLIFSDCRPTI